MHSTTPKPKILSEDVVRKCSDICDWWVKQVFSIEQYKKETKKGGILTPFIISFNRLIKTICTI